MFQDLPVELRNKVFYFMSHPCADMIKKAYCEASSFVWIDDDENDRYIKDWTERQFNLTHGRKIELSNESYDYEERLNNIKNRILDSESDSDCESDHYPEDASVCYVS